MQVLSKGIRATQLYLPNNPVYQRAVDNIRAAFRQIWQATDDLHFDVGETELRWEDAVVYNQAQRNESIAWTLYKDGVRSLTFRPGVEEAEIVRFLGVLQQARGLQADAADDLLTLLWTQDFQFIAYTFRELASENAAPIEAGETISATPPTQVRQTVEQEAPPRREGLVSMDDFDTTLYFLEDKEVGYLKQEVDREYAQDLRRNVLSMLFDLLELQTYGTVRAELVSIVENFIPYLLGAADFRSVAYILRETRVLLQRARELIPEHRQTLEGLPSRLSQHDALSQLLQSLDEAAVHPTEEDLAELFQELRAEALPTLMGWIPKLHAERVKELVQTAASRLAQAHAAEVLKALASEDGAAQLEMVKLAGRLKLPGAPEGMEPLLDSEDRTLKLAVVEALQAISSPSAMRLLETAIDDPDRDVRIAAVRFLAARGYRNAAARVEAAVSGSKLKNADLTEKMAFFEAFGSLVGPKGIPALEKMLVAKGLLGKKEDPETRACAAMALGKIRTAEARAVLERAAQDKEALVRNAVSRALREVGAGAGGGRMTGGSAPRGSIAETVQATDGFLRHAGRDFLVVLYTAFRSLKLYPVENAQVQKALDDLTATTKQLLDVEKELELRMQGEFIFVNSVRLRLDLDNYASFSHILGVLRQCGIGAVRIDEGVERKQFQLFVSLLLSYAAKEVSANKALELGQKLADAGVTHIGVEPPLETDEDVEDAERQKEAAKRTYARSVAVTKEVINSIRMGRTANVKKVKRAVQAIVDQVLNNEASLVGLTTLRDYDEYTFTHSVNVCIFSVALGRKLGLSKLQLYDLGMAALFHDVGKSRVPLEVLNKQGGLSDEEWRIMQAHPWLGVLTLFGLRGYGEIPYRGMIVAYEHHMKTDLTGYPKSVRGRELSIYSKIVAVADGFDAATSRRVYQTVPIQPDQVLKEMWENPRRGYDPVVVKAFINLIGVYPVGTCIILDTLEVAIVHSANPDVSQVHRPVVRIVTTPEGAIQHPGFLADLAQRDAQGNFPRTIVKVTDPAKYGINVSDYFV